MSNKLSIIEISTYFSLSSIFFLNRKFVPLTSSNKKCIRKCSLLLPENDIKIDLVFSCNIKPKWNFYHNSSNTKNLGDTNHKLHEKY